ncbi:Zinc carboxypeptidase family [gamma proteobacterium NOR5-3]|nr:Zinc carboxypeptidase family [gamma proteobacterium NOR5-3]
MAFLTGTLSPPVYARADERPACEQNGITVYRNFPGAAFDSCAFSKDGTVEFVIRPEDKEINPSPWYAFRVVSNASRRLPVVLNYGRIKHRYLPDVNYDGHTWQPLNDAQVISNPDETRVQFSVALHPAHATTVAAQPLLAGADYRAWIDSLDSATVSTKEIGRSPLNNPLWRLTTAPKTHTLLLIGRQHPPETTGAIAMLAFMERLFAQDELAREFRQQVGILAYPLLNPDGVELGYWRHNTGSQDLNRDWGPFTQIETRSVASDIDEYLGEHATTLIKSIDFHSTWYEVFYTQEDATADNFPALLGNWMTEFERAMKTWRPDFALNRKPSHNADRPTAKSYFFERYGVASTTLEIGDATPDAYTGRYAQLAAESFMRVWLEQSR